MAAKRDRERCHWLVLLRNHQPLVALLDEPVAGDGVLDVIASEVRDVFEIGGTTVTPGETDGFTVLLTCSVSNCVVVAVDSVCDVAVGGTSLRWATLHGCGPMGQDLQRLVGRFYSELQGLFVPEQAHASIRRPWDVVELDETVTVVPDLNKHLRHKGVLVLQFDCATQKSRHIIRLAKEHLQFHPRLRIVFLSCRIVHAHDLKADLAAAFPAGCGTEFSLYSNKADPTGRPTASSCS